MPKDLKENPIETVKQNPPVINNEKLTPDAIKQMYEKLANDAKGDSSYTKNSKYQISKDEKGPDQEPKQSPKP
jgi:hypothetical protein